MPKEPKKFKSPPKKYQPKGISILYEDHDIVVVDKTQGLLTITHENTQADTAYELLNLYVRKGNFKSRNRVFIVHRLDRETSGVLVFAKSEEAKTYLQKEWKNFKKIYHVVVDGVLAEKEGVITSYLAENDLRQMYSVKDPKKGKFSKTGYTVIKESMQYSLLEIKLFTGRKNQIRAHLSELGHPVTGDKKYRGKKKGIKRLALHSALLTIRHPHTREEMTFTVKTPRYFKTLLANE